jgi:hypothetical protein
MPTVGRFRSFPAASTRRFDLHAFAGLWLTPDGQHVMNPGCNADRGLVSLSAAGYTSSSEIPQKLARLRGQC